MRTPLYIGRADIFGMHSFFNYAIADGLYNLLFPDKNALNQLKRENKQDFQLCFDFW